MFQFARQLVKSAEGIISNQGDDYNRYGRTQDDDSTAPSHGFRVIHVQQHSAAREAGVESLFDFVVGLNGHDLIFPTAPSGDNGSPFTSETPPIDDFVQEISNCRGRSVVVDLWSAKGRVRRSVVLPVPELAPALIDGANRTNGVTDFGIGMTVQWTPLEVADHVWHVLNVSPNSPAEIAGLVSHSDYIIAAENGILEAGGEGLLARVITRIVAGYYSPDAVPDPSVPAPEIEFYVYNHDYDTVRPVRIQPRPNWGGPGMLGCGVGYGILHRLPPVAGKPGATTGAPQSNLAPGDTLFEAEDADTSNFIIPASLAPSAALSSPPQAPPPKRKHHHAPPPSGQQAADLNSYFAEEEQKSRQLDGSRSTPLDPSLPPPPPPKAKS